MTRRWFCFIAAACLAISISWASPQNDRYMRLARFSYIEGPVSFQHPSDVDWSAASVNMPLVPRDRIYTGRDGRAEIQFDDGSAFRLAENTDIEILTLDEDLIQIRVLLGLATLTLSGSADFEINTPAAAFNAVREGVYRFDVIENGDTDAIVRRGELEAADNEFSRRIKQGELLHVSPVSKGNPEISLYDRRDEWDEWTDRRTADLRAHGNRTYIPDNVYIGASDLGQYGRWITVESYGSAWVPYGVDSYWSPYSTGRWCYRPFFGWTWISYEPWGWLPYHYGSWYRSSYYGWCWLPGPAFAFNFWSPALVTFYSGPGWVSWCPLGPGDYYDVRRYHYNHGIYSHQMAELRGLHTRLPGEPFNRDVRGAFRTASVDDFRDGSFDSRNRNTRWGNVERPWSEGSLVRDRLPVQPTSKSYSAAPGRAAAGPRVTSTLPAVVRTVPERGSESQSRFTRITNPAVSSVSSRSLRSRSGEEAGAAQGSGAGGRVIQSNASGAPPAGQANGRTIDTDNSSRWSGSRSSGANNGTRSRGGSSVQSSRPENSPPSSRESAPAKNNERTVPEKRTAPEQKASPQRGSNPRSELRPQKNSARPAMNTAQPGDSQPYAASTNNAGPAAGSHSANARSEAKPTRSYSWRSTSVRNPDNPGGGMTRSAQPGSSNAPQPSIRNRGEANANPGIAPASKSYNPPSSSGSRNWADSTRRSYRSSESGSAPAYNPPPSAGGVRSIPSYNLSRSGGWGNPGLGSGRSIQSFSAPRQAGPSGFSGRPSFQGGGFSGRPSSSGGGFSGRSPSSGRSSSGGSGGRGHR